MNNTQFEKNTRIRRTKRLSNEIRLREYRESIGLTQDELGKIVGVNARTISAYELGTRKPSVKIGVKLTKIFKAKLEEIFPAFE